MVTHYHSASKGPVEIASMNHRHLLNSRDKLAREEPHRVAEIEAMTARLVVLDAEQAQQDATDAYVEPDPAPETLAPIGHNQPPEATPFEALKAHADDLLLEARNWADGKKVETQAEADECLRLIDDLQKADEAMDAQRVAEKKPLDDKVAAIQALYNPYIAPLTNKKPGSIPKAVDALKKTRQPFLLEQDRLRQKAIDDAAAEAAAKNKAAADAMAEAQASSDLELRDVAEALVDDARAATVFARAVAKPVATGLRDNYVATLTDTKAALLHYYVAQHERMKEFLQQLAAEDVRAKKYTIPGFEVKNERRAA